MINNVSLQNENTTLSSSMNLPTLFNDESYRTKKVEFNKIK